MALSKNSMRVPKLQMSPFGHTSSDSYSGHQKSILPIREVCNTMEAMLLEAPKSPIFRVKNVFEVNEDKSPAFKASAFLSLEMSMKMLSPLMSRC